jgi:hypothetical protein
MFTIKSPNTVILITPRFQGNAMLSMGRQLMFCKEPKSESSNGFSGEYLNASGAARFDSVV